MGIIKKAHILFGSFKIKYKLFLVYFPVTIILVSMIGYFSYSQTVKVLKSQSIKLANQSLRELSSSIASKAHYYEYIAYNISINPTIRKFVEKNFDDLVDEFNFSNEIENVLNSYLRTFDSAMNVGFINYRHDKHEIIKDNFHSIIRKSRQNILETKGNLYYQFINLDRVKDRPWVTSNMKEKSLLKWVQVEDDGRFKNISLLKNISGTGDEETGNTGMLVLTIKVSDLFNIQNLPGKTDGFYYMLFKDDGTPLFEQENSSEIMARVNSIKSLVSDKQDEGYVYDDNMIIMKSKVGGKNWYLVSLIPVYEITKTSDGIRMMVLITFVVGALVLFAVTFFIAQYFSNRINTIATAMKKFKNGDKNIIVSDTHADELGFLADTYNEMHNRIQLLISEVYEISILKKDAELKALQAQINPHFLYNSLAYVGRVARYGNSQKINQMIESLAVFYRITLNKGKSIIPINEEIRQIKAYMDVFRIRMEDLFRENFQINDDILDCLILKVILQPFVENILEHALGEREEPINIIIKGYREDNLIILKVIDDGLGFDSKRVRIEDISSARGSGYGIKNVNERIKLQYGDSYGVDVFSRRGIGTVATITLPYLKK